MGWRLKTPSEAKEAAKAKKAREKTQRGLLSEAKDPDSKPVNSFKLLSDDTGGGVDGMIQYY